ncbi:response regulator transcription factor [Nodosilinea sp. LEGE 07088]|uniref:response regulator n=1 Tax=Nodosilinea sp. LEGE 07088 TaxID=2777968 RepID=UPI00187EED5B|nr:response regulator transcription factor [Nodosilinea sp. LEGE 07088]MBE9136002.1 response regulator transcription factor [Nodosilinea sp. LEGE 07088]
MPQTILIVEDDAEIARFTQQLLEKEGFACLHSRDGLDAVRQSQVHQPSLIILDWMLPGIDGLEACTRIRKLAGTHDPYILMLTAKGEEFDRVIGLSTGADDYLVKPFSPMELVARVRALLRRSLRQEAQSQVYRTLHFTVDLDRHVATQQIHNTTEDLDLTTTEFDLLATFLSHPGRAWSRAYLVEKLWGNDFFGEERVVDTHVARLRKKIELDPSQPQFIKTVVGMGYKFADEG